MDSQIKPVNALIFARFSSSRLRGKVLYEIDNTTILGICVSKLRMLRDVNAIVTTSDHRDDDAIAEWCTLHGTAFFRGSLEDVADRTVACLKKYPCDAFFRVNADSPFLQVELLSRALEIYNSADPVDLVTNVYERSYPYGIAVELVNARTFTDHTTFFNDGQREHITSYFYQNASLFRIKNLKHTEDLSSLRLTLDTPDDWEHIKTLYSRDKNLFNLNFLQLTEINKKEK